MTAPLLHDVAELLDAVDGAPDDFHHLAAASGHLEAYQTSLLLLADARGNVIVADDLGSGIGPDVAGPLAVDLARRLEARSTCQLEVATNVGPRLALAVRMPDRHQGKILACLVPPGEVFGQCLDQMPGVLVVCGALARAALQDRAGNAKLHRRMQHLLAKQETLEIAHAGAMATIVKQREQRRRQQQQKAALEELVHAAEAANRAKSRFLANASHELRTPLTAILGYADLLSDRELSADQQSHHLQTIRRNGRLLLELINDILDLSKIEAGKLSIEQAECSPCHLVEELVSLMQVQAEEKGLSLEVGYDFPIPEKISTDPVRLRQILINLVGNAIKFTEKGGVRITISCAQHLGNSTRLQFAVADTGTGIAAEMISQLFSPFTQADASASRAGGGSGLGLAISDRLAKMLGGHIEVKSELGRGSTFMLSIDSGPLRGVPMLEAPPKSRAAQDPSAHAEADRKLCGRVLLAEDGKDNQRLIGLFLRKAGLEVDLAENGSITCQSAFASIAEGKPYDLILMDMQMPEMDGYEATRRLRQGGWRRPIVALTAYAMAGDREKCLEAGCDDYLSKPIERKAFLATVARYLADALPV